MGDVHVLMGGLMPNVQFQDHMTRQAEPLDYLWTGSGPCPTGLPPRGCEALRKSTRPDPEGRRIVSWEHCDDIADALVRCFRWVLLTSLLFLQALHTRIVTPLLLIAAVRFFSYLMLFL